jgi:HK97 family phage prohead protease
VDLVRPDRVTVVTEGNGTQTIRINGEPYNRADLFHVKAFPWPGSLLGLSPIAYARESIGLGLGAEKYGAKLFGDAAIPSGVLTTDQRVGDESARDLKARWKNAHQGRREIAVLGGGAKFQPITISPDEAQFIQTQKFNVATICRFYGVPPEMMAGETAGHEAYTSPEMRGTDFLTFTLRPLAGPGRAGRLGAAAIDPDRQVQRRGVRPRHPARPLRSPPHRHRGRVPDPQRGPRARRPPTPARRPARGRRMTVLIREVATGLQVRDDGDGRILFGPLLPWDVEARVLDRGRLVVETFARGALAGTDPTRVPLTALHPRDNQQLPIGIGTELEERDDAAWGAWKVSRTAAGDEVLSLAADGVPLGLSIGFREVAGGSRWSADRRRVVRTRAELDHIAVVRTPAYVGAGVVGVRSSGSACPAPALLTLARLRG